MRRRRRTAFHEPSLVPMADMLSNTVGIMVFILIFTVLTASGAKVIKQLPLERDPGGKSSVVFACYGDRLLPMGSFESVSDRCMQPRGGPRRSVSGFYDWSKWFDGRKVELECFTVRCEARVDSWGFFGGMSYSLRATIDIQPKGGTGENTDQFKAAGSWSRSVLRKYPADKYFAFFVVYPDGLEVFREARNMAREEGYDIGWEPEQADSGIGVNVIGGGGHSVRPL